MNATKVFIILILLNLSANSLYAQTTKDDPSLLALYNRSIKAIRMPSFLPTVDSLLQEARSKKDIKFEGYALSSITTYYSLMNDSAKFIDAFNKEFDFYLAHNETSKAWGSSNKISLFFINHRNNLPEALRQAYRLLDKATQLNDLTGKGYSYYNIARCFRAQKEYDNALQFYRQAHEIGKQIKNPTLEIKSGLGVTYILRVQESYTSADSVCISIPPYIEKWEQNKGFHNPLFRGLQLIEQTYIDIFLNRKEAAAQHLRQAEIESALAEQANETGMKSDITQLQAAYAAKYGRYDEAEKGLLTLIGIRRELDDKRIAIYYKQLADLYEEHDEKDKAIEAYKLYIASNDSIRLEESAQALNRLRTQYEVKELKMQNQLDEQRIRTTRLRFIFALCGCFLLLILLGILFIHYRIIRRKNEALYRQIVERQEMERNKKETKQIIPDADSEKTKPTAEQILFNNLNNLLDERPELLADEELGREQLSKLLATNTTYLHSAIRSCANDTVNGYLNRLRVRKIGQLLQLSPELSLEALRTDYGFSSHTTFYRFFRQEYGMSPSEFRRCVQNSIVEK